jgi:hypothetical protein
MQDRDNFVKKIHSKAKIKNILALASVFAIIAAVFSFLFYGFVASSNAIKFTRQKEQIKKLKKVMSSPKIKLDYKDGQIFDIKAQKAIHIDDNDIKLFDVDLRGQIGTITAENLLVKNAGNDLHFSGNPVLIIKEIKDE